MKNIVEVDCWNEEEVSETEWDKVIVVLHYTKGIKSRMILNVQCALYLSLLADPVFLLSVTQCHKHPRFSSFHHWQPHLQLARLQTSGIPFSNTTASPTLLEKMLKPTLLDQAKVISPCLIINFVLIVISPIPWGNIPYWSYYITENSCGITVKGESCLPSVGHTFIFIQCYLCNSYLDNARNSGRGRFPVLFEKKILSLLPPELSPTALETPQGKSGSPDLCRWVTGDHGQV